MNATEIPVDSIQNWKERQKTKSPLQNQTQPLWSEGAAHAAILCAALLPVAAQKIGPLPIAIAGSIAAGGLLFIAKNSEVEGARTARWFTVAMAVGSLSALAIGQLQPPSTQEPLHQQAAMMAQIRRTEAGW